MFDGVVERLSDPAACPIRSMTSLWNRVVWKFHTTLSSHLYQMTLPERQRLFSS